MKEISEMTNEELNYAVAVEVMGWSKESNEHGQKIYTNADGYEYVGNWLPTTHIFSAWQVVERMRKDKWWYEIYTEYTDPEYFAKFGSGDWPVYSSSCETQQRAICEAALKAIRKGGP